jgi:hemoglobin
MSADTTKPTLYDRLGGVYSIAAVVDDFIDRVMHNPVLNANPAVDEAHHRVSAAGFKYYVTEMVCWATGGPQKYTGRAMNESHKDLKITEGEWAAFCKDFDRWARAIRGVTWRRFVPGRRLPDRATPLPPPSTAPLRRQELTGAWRVVETAGRPSPVLGRLSRA